MRKMVCYEKEKKKVFRTNMLLIYLFVGGLRGRCTVLRDYPLNRIDIGGNLVDLFPEGTIYHVRVLRNSGALGLTILLDTCSQCPEL
jgi:hypothetical protein